MRYPALSRLLAVFLAVLSVTTLVAGALGFGKAAGDYREQQRADALLETRIETSRALRAELAEKQAAYDAANAVYPERAEKHRSRSDSYRMTLATYTATRAGLKIGLQQLLDAAALLDESLNLFLPGYSVFAQAEEAFAKVYQIYLTLLDSLVQGAEIIDGAETRLSEEEGEEDAVFSPDEILALAELGHSSYGQLSELLMGLREVVPEDQHGAADFLRRAVENYNEAGLGLEDFSVERLAYGVSRALYDEAEAALEAEREGGLSEEEARAAADRICMESFGLSFDELGQWLAEHEPEAAEGSGEAVTIPPEMMEMLFDELPDDRDLIDTALALITESDRALSEKEAAFRADPHDMSAAALLLEAGREGLDSVDRILDLIRPTIMDLGQQLLAIRAQLDEAWLAIMEGKRQVDQGLAELDQQERGLPEQLLEIRRERRVILRQKEELDGLQAVIEGYEQPYERLRSLRAQLLADDAIYEQHKAGTDYLDAAQAELALRIPAHRSEFLQRCVMCTLMLLSGLVGMIGALGAFEKPRIRHMWMPLLAAALPSAVAEAISLRLGRGLLYSALFVIIFALLMLPLCQRQKKGEKP